MSARSQAFVWAFVIISAALACVWAGLSDAASFGVIGGLTGTALGSLSSEVVCLKGCLQ